MKSKLFLVLFWSLLVAQDLVAATYYVSTTGNNSNPGTALAPFLTVQKGVDTATTAGDIVLIGAGTYAETVLSKGNGTYANRIVIDGQGVASVNAFQMRHDYNVLNNLTILGKATTRDWWVFVDKGGHHLVISNTVFEGNWQQVGRMLRWENPQPYELPFGTNCASGCIIISNTFQNLLGGLALQLHGDTNLIYGNRFIGGDASDWMHLWGRTNIIAANVFSNVFVSGASANHPDWVQTFDNNGHGAKGLIIESNIIADLQQDTQLSMLSVYEATDYISDFTFRNNLFVGISKTGYSNMRNAKWYNNTFYHCATNQGSVLVGYIAAHGIEIINNAFIDCGTGDTNLADGWYSIYSTIGLTNCVADFNMVSINGFSPNEDEDHRAVGDPGGWSRFSWWEPHGIPGGSAGFVNPSAFDFRLATNSIMIGAGTNFSSLFTTDRIGTTRPAIDGWSIGAYEGGVDTAVPRRAVINTLRVGTLRIGP